MNQAHPLSPSERRTRRQRKAVLNGGHLVRGVPEHAAPEVEREARGSPSVELGIGVGLCPRLPCIGFGLKPGGIF